MSKKFKDKTCKGKNKIFNFINLVMSALLVPCLCPNGIKKHQPAFSEIFCQLRYSQLLSLILSPEDACRSKYLGRAVVIYTFHAR